MDWYYTLYIVLVLVSAAIQTLQALYVWQRRSLPGARSYFWLKPLTIGWLVSLALEIASPDLESKRLWNTLRFACISSATFASFIFVLDFTGHHAWLHPRRLVPLALVPAAAIVLNLTNPLHGLVWRDYQVFQVGTYLLMERGSEPWFVLFVLYSYGLIVVLLSLLARMVMTARPPYRMQALIILIAFGSIPIAHILYIFQIIPGLSLMPILNVLGGLLIIWALFHYRLFDIVPVAHHLLVQQMREGLIVLDARQRVLELNPAAQALFGPPAALLGRPVTEALPVLAPGLDISDASAAHQGVECHLPADSTAAGQAMWVEVTVSPISGQLQQRGWIVLLHDRTEQHQMQQRIQESEAKYRSVSERANDGIAIVQANRVRYANPQLAHLLGTTVDAMQDQPVQQFFAPAVWPTAEANHTRRMRGEPAPTRYETYLQHQAGLPIPVEVNISMIDYVGQPATLAFIRDMTERNRAEDAVRKLSRAVEQSPAAIVITDTTGAIEYVNPWFTHITGYTLEEALGQNPRVLKSGNVPPHVYTDLWRTITAGREWTGELQNRNKNGALFWEDIRIGPVWNDAGTITHYVAVKYDITERKRLEADLRQARDTAEGLNRLSNVLQRCTSLHEAYGVSIPFLRTLFANQTGGLYIYHTGDPATNGATVATLVGQWGDAGADLPPQRNATCPALVSGQACLIEAEEVRTEDCAACRRHYLTAMLCVPLQTGGEQLGLLHLQGTLPSSDADGERWSRLALMTADLLALAFTNLRLREDLREQAVRDPLTSLFNRHILAELGEQRLYEAARHQRTLGVFLIDIDHFKRINDTYGHEAGDAVLRMVGSFLRNDLRSEDIACRFGGEEFLLILPEIAPHETLHRADMLREGLQKLAIAWHNEVLPTITVSIGVASFPDHGSDLDELIASADAALYRAKGAGRNQVCLAAASEEPA